MNTLLVTGGAGFLGSTFVRHWLADQPGRVLVLDKLTYAGHLDSLASLRGDERLSFRRGDIANRRLVERLLAEHRPAAIVNFAAETHVDRSIDAPAPFVHTNVVGASQLLGAALAYWRELTGAERDAFRFLHVSTDEVFGPIAAPHLATEDSPYRPTSPYAASKAAADHLVRAFGHTYGLPTLVVHPTNNYGPFQFPEKLIPLAILNAREGRPIPIYGDGRQQRDWLFAEDLSCAISVLLRHGAPGQSYHVASGELRTNLDVVQQICDLVDQLADDLPTRPAKSLLVHVADRPSHDVRYALDASRIRQLGWQPALNFSAGLAQTVRWYLENGAWVERVAAEFDRSRRLGLG